MLPPLSLHRQRVFLDVTFLLGLHVHCIYNDVSFLLSPRLWLLILLVGRAILTAHHSHFIVGYERKVWLRNTSKHSQQFAMHAIWKIGLLCPMGISWERSVDLSFRECEEFLVLLSFHFFSVEFFSSFPLNSSLSIMIVYLKIRKSTAFRVKAFFLLKRLPGIHLESRIPSIIIHLFMNTASRSTCYKLYVSSEV